MIPRYSRPEMARLWSDENRFATWLEAAAWLLYLHSAVNRARRAAMAGLAAPWSNGGPEGRG